MSFFGSFVNSTSSSRSASKSSSHMSNKVKREVARLAVDAFKSMSAEGRNVTDDGKKYARLAGELGDDDFKRYCAEPPILSVQKIHYCQSMLEQFKNMASGSLESSKKELKNLSGEQVTTEEVQGIQKVIDRNLHGHASSYVDFCQGLVM
jgi:hypothetical protein